MKRLLIFSLVLLMLFGASFASAAEKLVFWAYEPVEYIQRDIMANIIKDFEKTFSDVKVEIIYLPKGDFETKLITAMAVGEGPDIFYLDQPLVSKFAADGVILNLSSYMRAKDFEKNMFLSGPLNTCEYNGAYYGLPISQTAVALIYNKDLVSTPPKTWDEFLKIAKAVYKEDNIAAFGVPSGDGWGAWIFPAFVHAAGGEMVDQTGKKAVFNSQAGVDALELWVELLKYSPRKILDSANSFETGHVAMIINGPWMLDHWKNNWPDLNFGITLIPKKTRYATNIGGEDIVIASYCKYPEEAWNFIKFVTNKDHAADLAMVMGSFPTRADAAKDPRFTSDPGRKMFMEQMKYSFARPRARYWLKINDEIISKALREAMAGEKSAKEALDEAAQRANILLQEGSK